MRDATHLARLRSMLRQVAPGSQLENLAEAVSPGGSRAAGADAVLESTSPDDDGQDQLDIGRPGDPREVALESLDVLVHGGDLNELQQEALEAIVLKIHRPVVNIVSGKFAVPPFPWTHLGDPLPQARLEAAIRSIGRIEIPNHPEHRPYAGTGFVVGKLPTDETKHLLMTNRHVAALFAGGLGQRGLAFHPGQQVQVDFAREIVPAPPQLLQVDRVVMIHPYWDMALVSITGLAADQPILSLSTTDPSAMEDRDIVIIGYPAQDGRNDLELQNRIFGGMYEVKRLQPGKLKTREEVESYGKLVNAVTHDSSTLGGNSGSSVIEFSEDDPEAPARVVGLHFAGVYLKANYAVPTYDLAQDSRVVNAGVNFAGRVEPRGDFYGPIWAKADDRESAAPGAGASRGNSTQSPPPIVGVMPADGGGPAAPVVSGGTVDWTIPIQVSVSMGSPQLTTGAVSIGTAVSRIPLIPAEGSFSRRQPQVARSFVNRFSADSLLAARFDWRTALSLVLASELAYALPAAVLHTARNIWQLRTCQFVEEDDTQCFVASSDESVLVAFRGTQSLGDWLADLNALSTNRSYGTIHRGFRNAFAMVDSRLRAALSSHGNKPVLITGHSLGGALAMIAAAEWQGQFPVKWVSTYGQPCVGRNNYATFMTRRYPTQLIRFVNDDDIVPRVPPTYQHVGRLVHFDAGGNVPGFTESLAAEAVPSSSPAPMSEAEFDQLRAQMLELRARRRAAGATQSMETLNLEGFFPSFSDHKIARYIEKIAAKVP